MVPLAGWHGAVHGDGEPAVRLRTWVDGQLRQAGVGDLVVGKRMGKIMGALGGRIAALREGLASVDTALAEVACRNATLIEHGDPAKIAVRLRDLAKRLDAPSGEELLAGKVAA